MSAILQLLSALAGIAAVVLVGRMVWQVTTQRNTGALLSNLGLIVVLLACWSGLRTFIPTPAPASPSTFQEFPISVFPASYQLATDSSTPGDMGYANSIVTTVANIGIPIATAIWDGLNANIGGGITIFALVVAFVVGQALVSYAIRPDPMALMGKTVLLAFLLLSVTGPPSALSGSRPWIPRTVISVCSSFMRSVAATVDKAFHTKLQKAENLAISPGSMMAMAYASRPPSITYGPLSALIIGARYQGSDIASDGYISDAAAARLRGTIYPAIPVSSTMPMVEVEAKVGTRTEVSRIPVEVAKTFVFGNVHAIYLGEEPNAWVDRFLRTDPTSPFQLLTFPNRANNDFTEAFWSQWFNRSYTPPSKTIAVIPLGDGPWDAATRPLKEAIDRAYAAAQERISQVEAQSKRVLYGRYGYAEGSGAPKPPTLAVEEAKLVSNVALARRTLTPPAIEVAQVNPLYLQSVGLQRPATSVMSTTREIVRSAYYGMSAKGAAGSTCTYILQGRSYNHPSAWGCLLSALERSDRSVLSTSDPVNAIERYRAQVTATFNLPRSGLLDSLFATPEARGLVDPERSTVLQEQSTSWAAGFFAKAASLLQTLGGVTTFYPQEVLNAGLTTLAIIAAPMVVGFALAFIIGFWPIMALASFLRWTALLDWAKAVMWVMAWVPVVSLGRALIADVSLIPDNYALAQVQSTIGVLVIMSAPVVAKVVLSPSVDGLAGIAGLVVATTATKVGQQIGAGVDALKSGGTSALDIGKQAQSQIKEIRSKGEQGGTTEPSEADSPPATEKEGGHEGESAPSAPGHAERPGGRTPQGQTPGGTGKKGPGGSGTGGPKPSPGAPTRQSQGGGALRGLSAKAGGAVARSAIGEGTRRIAEHQGRSLRLAMGLGSPQPTSDRMAAAAAAGVDGNVHGAAKAMQGGSGGGYPPSVGTNLSHASHALTKGNLAGAMTSMQRARVGAAGHRPARHGVAQVAEHMTDVAMGQLGTADGATQPQAAAAAGLGEAIQAEMAAASADDEALTPRERESAAARRDTHAANARHHLAGLEAAGTGGEPAEAGVARAISSILASIQQPSPKA